MKKTAIAAAVAAATAIPVAARAVSFKVSGHINRAIRLIDDGQGSTVQHVDNGASRSRVRFVGSDKFGSMSAGVYLEIGFASNRTTLLGGKDAADGGDSFDTGDDIRHSALWFGGDWGRVWFGHTSDAYDGVQFTDNSGTGLIDSPFADDVTGVAIRTDTGGSFSSVGSVFTSLDGGRLDVIRYDSPKFGPVSGSIAHGNNDHWSGALKLSTSFAGHKLDAAIGGRDHEGRNSDTRYGGSASILFAQGTSLTFSYGMADLNTSGRDDVELLFIKVGHKWGNNAVSLSYQYNECAAIETADGCDEGDKFELGWVHTIPKIGGEVYASYNHYEIDHPTPSISLEDIDAFMVGTRIKFN
ncbi:MAG: porin [Pseudomonadota bacterium]